jgi:hypothetical protein
MAMNNGEALITLSVGMEPEAGSEFYELFRIAGGLSEQTCLLETFLIPCYSLICPSSLMLGSGLLLHVQFFNLSLLPSLSSVLDGFLHGHIW